MSLESHALPAVQEAEESERWCLHKYVQREMGQLSRRSQKPSLRSRPWPDPWALRLVLKNTDWMNVAQLILLFLGCPHVTGLWGWILKCATLFLNNNVRSMCFQNCLMHLLLVWFFFSENPFLCMYGDSSSF